MSVLIYACIIFMLNFQLFLNYQLKLGLYSTISLRANVLYDKDVPHL